MEKILVIFNQEWALKRRSSVLTLLFVVMQALLVTALISSWSQYSRTIEQQSAAQALVEKQWNEQPARHPHRVAHFGHFTFRPPSALSFFDNGVNHFVGNSIFIEAHRQNSANFANDQNSESLLRFSELSVANILLLFWPLLLIALGYNTITSERQTGTLRQLLSIDISFSQLLLGKGLCYAFLSILFIAPVFILTLALVLSSDISLVADSLIRIGGLFALYLAYCLVWILLILFVSSVVAYPRNALNSLISIWFILTIVSPRLLADIAAQQYPQLDRNSFDKMVKAQVSKVGDSHNPDDPHFNEFKAKTLAQYGVDDVKDLPINYRALVIQEGERISSEIFTNLYKQQMKKQRQQHQLVSLFYWLNPYLMARDTSMAVAGTDVWHFYDYEMQSEHHRFARIEKLNKIHAEHIDAEHDRGAKAEPIHWHTFNAFEYQQPPLSQSLEPFKTTWPVPLIFLLMGLLLLSNPQVKRRVYALA